MKIRIYSLGKKVKVEQARFSKIENAYVYDDDSTERVYRRGQPAVTKAAMARQGDIFVKRDKLAEQRRISKAAHEKNIGFIQRRKEEEKLNKLKTNKPKWL